MNRLIKVLALLVLCVIASTEFARAADLAWPAVTNETKPWSRWWWLGSISTEDSLRTEMQKYAAVGLGGLEITPIYGVRGQEDKFINYLSPQWMDRFAAVLREAKRLDMGIDIATGNGWPFGGPWVGDEDASKYLAQKTFTVAAGQRATTPITMTEQVLLSFAGTPPARVPIDQIKDPVGENTNLQQLAINQVRFPKRLPLHTLMAFSDKGGEPLNLTAKVSVDGTLDWTAPADSGTWTLYAIFSGLHGKQVERAGPGGEGNVIDHFSVNALQNYFKPFDKAFAGRDLSGLRAFFNDSYEVDDARGESNFTPRFFDEFQRRRGYDLRTQLPALLGTQSGDQHLRVLSDARETISDLLLEEFTQPWRKWAAGHKTIVRNQAHGSPANILDLYAASDIPETEGNSLVAMKYASSAAHLTGKRLASSEACTWLGDHFISTLADVKQRIDLTFLGGINHICYHGTPYSPADEPWPGFLFYAAVQFCPVNPWWDDFAAFNQYVTRCQSFLQAGQPDEDVLLYVPFHDRWAVRGNGAMPHFGSNQNLPAAATADQLLQSGYTFDFVSDRLLRDVTFESGSLRSGGNSYKAIVLPETKLMSLETLEKLVALANSGATIFVTKALPADVPGWGRLDERRAKLQTQLEALHKSATTQDGLTTITQGKGRFLIADDIRGQLGKAGVYREMMTMLAMQFIRRRDADGRSYFVTTPRSKPVDGWIPLAAASPNAAVAIFDPLTGKFGRAATRPFERPDVSGGTAKNPGCEVYLQIGPGQSYLVKAFDSPPSGPQWTYRRPQGESQTLTGPWAVSFVKGGPELPAPVQVDKLASWTDFGGDAVKAFSGTAKYTVKFAKPQAKAEVFRLDLGRVAESATVSLNGAELQTVFAAPFQIDIPADKLKDENVLEVSVSNLMANRIADMDRRGVEWKKFYNTNFPANAAANRGRDGLFTAANWTPRESGLIGPVTLTALETFEPR